MSNLGIAYDPCKNCKDMDKCSMCELTYYRNGQIISSTADVVEVVRCKDCKHWHIEGYDPILERYIGSCQRRCFEYRYEFETDGNDYCSYGERREE